MRLWSLHPQYLDPAGLVALWREGLLAQKVLLGQTRGYRFHPQLNRFRACADPVLAIGAYLDEVAREAERRGYAFDRGKIVRDGACPKIAVRRGQIGYEWEHLLRKQAARSPQFFVRNSEVRRWRVHPLFVVVAGGMEEWERA
jgi:hypothetical protein